MSPRVGLNTSLTRRRRAPLPLCYPQPDDLKGDYRIFYDDSGSIGRRYRRQDEAGTPFCVTVDFDTLDDKKVTIRDRDTMEQERIPIGAVRDRLHNLIWSGT